MPTMTLRALLLAVAFVALPAQAQDAGYIITAPAYRFHDLSVLPGQSTTLNFSVTQSGTVVASALVAGYLYSREAAVPGYVFTSSDPVRCAVPTLQPTAYGPAFAFPIGPLAAGESLNCSYQVTRSASSVDDLSFGLCGTLTGFNLSCERVVRLGTLPDLALAVERAGVFGDGRQRVRVRVSNPGPVDVASRIVTTDCREYEGGIIASAAFSVASDFPGACAPASQTEACLNFTGVNAFAYGFDLGPIPAGGSATCLLELRPRAAAEVAIPGPAELYFLGDHMTRGDGGDAFDTNAANDLTLLGLQATTAAVVPIPPAAGIAIALALGVSGLFAVRRRRRPPQR
jgi:hypothetical protein